LSASAGAADLLDPLIEWATSFGQECKTKPVRGFMQFSDEKRLNALLGKACFGGELETLYDGLA
jgi:hypothetical protein